MDRFRCMGRIIERKMLRNALLAACGRTWLRLAATPATTNHRQGFETDWPTHELLQMKKVGCGGCELSKYV